MIFHNITFLFGILDTKKALKQIVYVYMCWAMINRIQNKSFCLHNIYVCTVYINILLYYKILYIYLYLYSCNFNYISIYVIYKQHIFLKYIHVCVIYLYIYIYIYLYT